MMYTFARNKLAATTSENSILTGIMHAFESSQSGVYLAKYDVELVKAVPCCISTRSMISLLRFPSLNGVKASAHYPSNSRDRNNEQHGN